MRQFEVVPRRMRASGLLWFTLSAALFLVGSLSTALNGSLTVSAVGLAGVFSVLAVVGLAFR